MTVQNLIEINIFPFYAPLFAGHTLVHDQKDVPIKGWSFECRVYAEVSQRAGFV